LAPKLGSLDPPVKRGVCLKTGRFAVQYKQVGLLNADNLIFKHSMGGLHVLVDVRIKALESGLFRAWRPCLRPRLFRPLRCILRCRCLVPVLATTSPSPVPSLHVTVCNRLAVSVCYRRASQPTGVYLLELRWIFTSLSRFGLVEYFTACWFCHFSKMRNTLVVWFIGNALVSVNKVTLHRTQLVLGWLTICRWVNHVSM